MDALETSQGEARELRSDKLRVAEFTTNRVTFFEPVTGKTFNFDGKLMQCVTMIDFTFIFCKHSSWPDLDGPQRPRRRHEHQWPTYDRGSQHPQRRHDHPKPLGQRSVK